MFYSVTVFHTSNRRPGSQTVYRGFQFRVYSSSSLGEYGGCGGFFHGTSGKYIHVYTGVYKTQLKRDLVIIFAPFYSIYISFL